MAAVLATLEAIESDGMMTNALAAERRLREGLAELPGIRGVRGRGCLLGIEFEQPAGVRHAELLERRIIVGTSSDTHVLRVLPPLCVTAEQIDLLVEALRG